MWTHDKPKNRIKQSLELKTTFELTQTWHASTSVISLSESDFRKIGRQVQAFEFQSDDLLDC